MNTAYGQMAADARNRMFAAEDQMRKAMAQGPIQMGNALGTRINLPVRGGAAMLGAGLNAPPDVQRPQGPGMDPQVLQQLLSNQNQQQQLSPQLSLANLIQGAQ